MNNKICIDKRIGYLMMFAIPVILLVVISSLINANRLSQNSKASEKPTPYVNLPTAAPTAEPEISICLTARQGKISGTVDLFPDTLTSMADVTPIKVYASDGNYLTLLSMPVKSTDDISIPLVTIKSTLLNSGSDYVFIGVQGGDANKIVTTEKNKWLSVSNECVNYKMK